MNRCSFYIKVNEKSASLQIHICLLRKKKLISVPFYFLFELQNNATHACKSLQRAKGNSGALGDAAGGRRLWQSILGNVVPGRRVRRRIFWLAG